MRSLPVLTAPVLVVSLEACADKTFYNMSTPASSQADQYVETEDLGKLPNKKIAITSFGIEYDTDVVYGKRNPKITGMASGSYRSETSTLDLSNEVMQQIADDAYGKLVKDLTAAGYEVIPYDTYKQSPAYQSLIKVIGEEKSPIKVTFRYGDSETNSNSDALVFAPTGMVWYQVAAGEQGFPRANTWTNVGQQISGAVSRGFSGEQPHVKSEIALADALNASVLKVYYIVSPVRSYVSAGIPVKGKTIVGSGETRMAFRTPGASTMHFTFAKKHPPLDGNAFVRLQKDVQLDTEKNTYQDIENHLDAVREMFITKLKAGK